MCIRDRHQAWRHLSGARHKALYQNLVYGKRLAYDISWARLDVFCLVPLPLRSAWRRRVAPNLNQKVENSTAKNYSVGMKPKRGWYVFRLFFKISPRSSTSMEISRRDLFNDMAEHRQILKNNQNTYHPRFSFTLKSSVAFPEMGFVFTVNFGTCLD